MRRVLLDGLWLVLVLLVTGAGMWLSSSLALYLNGPVWLAYLLGVLAFPVLPLAWEARAAMKRARTRSLRPPFFTVWDRLVLRTLAVNVLLVGVLLARWPTASFTALATRGDGLRCPAVPPRAACRQVARGPGGSERPEQSSRSRLPRGTAKSRFTTCAKASPARSRTARPRSKARRSKRVLPLSGST